MRVTLGVLAMLIVAYIVAAPYIIVYQIKSAAEKHDDYALSEHINFPSVRQSFKGQINTMLAEEVAQDEDMKDNPFAILGTAFAGLVASKMVDVLVTPNHIIQLMSGERVKLDLNSISTTGSNKGAFQRPWSDAIMGYESHDKFVVKVKDESRGEIKFILRRDGVSWKLTQIIIPID